MKRNLRKSKAFTLIEAILVAALIGLLAAIAVPKMGQLFQDQRLERAVLDVTMLNQGVALWRADNPGQDFYNGSDGAVDIAVAALDWSGSGDYLPAYTTAGYNLNTDAKLAESAFSLIRPYVGQAQNIDLLLELIDSGILPYHYYYWDTTDEAFTVGSTLPPS